MEEPIELLLVDDNASDVELTVHVLKKNNFSNRIKVVSRRGRKRWIIFLAILRECRDLPATFRS